MAHFAKLDENNVVLEVLVVSNQELLDENGIESEQKGIDFLTKLLGHSNWKQTSYNASFRKNYAGIGWSYDATRDAFIAPNQFPSWTLDEETCRWIPPVPRPISPSVWDEETQNWVTK